MNGAAPERWDVAVIGAGPAGLAAAVGARRAGAPRVLLLEREPRTGGILNQCVHDGFGLFMFKETISGPEYAERLAEEAAGEGVTVETGTMVVDLGRDLVLKTSSRSGYRLVRAGAVVLAMGCRERTRGMIGIPGTRPAGVFTAGLAQNLVNLQNLRIGRRAVILGSGDIGLIMARRLRFEGVEVAGVFEILPWPSGLERNLRQCLFDFGIPLELGTTVSDIRGRDRLEGVTVARVDERMRPVPGSGRDIACDTLLLAVGLIPENELSRKAGVELSPVTGGAAVDETFMTSVPGVFSCGNVLHIHDVADWASFEGYAAGREAALYAAGAGAGAAASVSSSGRVPVSASGLVRYVLPQRVRLGLEGFELSLRVARPVRNVTLEVREKDGGRTLFRKKYPRILPSEMQKIKVKGPVGNALEVVCLE